MTINKDGGSKSHSGNDADDDAGYVTANQEQQQPTGPIIPAMTMLKERKHFLGCETGEDAFSKASRRALQLRSARKSELLSKSRSKIRAAFEEQHTEPTETNDAASTTQGL